MVVAHAKKGQLESGVEIAVGQGQMIVPQEIMITGEHPLYETRPLLWPFLVRPTLWIIVGIVITAVAQQIQLEFIRVIEEIISLELIRSIIWWIGITVLIIGLLGILTKYLRWRYTGYTVTNRRILHQTGVIGKSYTGCLMNKVQNLYLQIPILGRTFNFGTIRIATAGTSWIEMQWKYVKEPRKVYRILNEALEQYHLEGEVGVGHDKRD